MSMSPLASLDDLDALIQGPTIDASRATAVLTRASSLVRSEAGRTWEDDAVPEEVVSVVLEVAKRVYLNPQNMRQSATGPFSGSYDMVGLYLSPEEKSIVRRSVNRHRGLYTLTTTRGEEYEQSIYVPTGPPPSGYPFPWYSSDDPL